MTENRAAPIILAIESAIEGGSISLFSGDLEIDHWVGGERLSRAEDLLANISELLNRNSIEKSQIDRLAVSVGPGSYTGIRIGLATMIGLKNALNIRCDGVSALEAMASGTDAKRVLCAVPMGRNATCYEVFEIEVSGKVRSISPPAIAASIENDIFNARFVDEIILHGSIFNRLENENFLHGRTVAVRNIGQNLAFLIGKEAGQHSEPSCLEPLFVSPHT